MVKNNYFFCLCLLVLTSTNTYAQNWIDSLDMARYYHKKGAYQKADQYYQAAQKIAPKNIDLSREIAQNHYRNNNFKAADQAYQKTRLQKIKRSEKGKYFHNLGNTRFQQKRYQEAIEAFKSALRMNPNDPASKYNLSESIRRLKKDKNKDKPKDKNKQKDKPKPKNKDKDKKPGKNPPRPSKLPNKIADKILDKLTKQESKTRRKIARKKKGNKAQYATDKNW